VPGVGSRYIGVGGSSVRLQEAEMAKGSEKPKKGLKKQPQKTLKERRAEKRAAKKAGSG
jgi:hypothetical protein